MQKIVVNRSRFTLWIGLLVSTLFCFIGLIVPDAIVKCTLLPFSLLLLGINLWMLVRKVPWLTVDDSGICTFSLIGVKKVRWDELQGLLIYEVSGQKVCSFYVTNEDGSKNPKMVKAGLGKNKESYSICEQILTIALSKRSQSKADETSSLNLMQSLVRLYFQQGKYSDAMQTEEKILHLREKSSGSNDVSVAGTLLSMATIAKKTDQFQEAIALSQRASNIIEKVSGTYSLDYVTCLKAQAEILRSAGRGQEAEKCESEYRAIVEVSPQLKIRPKVSRTVIFIGFALLYGVILFFVKWMLLSAGLNVDSHVISALTTVAFAIVVTIGIRRVALFKTALEINAAAPTLTSHVDMAIIAI